MESSRNSKKKIIVAVDGFSSCGKSTFARGIASMLGYVFIDSGAMYRTVTLCAIRGGAIEGGELDEERLVGMLDHCNMEFRHDSSRGTDDIYLNGENVEHQIRSIEVSSWVSPVSRIPAVRSKLVAQQQKMGSSRGVVMDGRDIGTVVFPDAELKIFMTADPEVRAQRRYTELAAKGAKVSLGEIEKNIRDRDFADQNRPIAPLRKASDAIMLDNSTLSVAQQLEWVKTFLRKAGAI